MHKSTSTLSFASNLHEIIRLARICLSKEEFSEFLMKLAQHAEKEAA